MITLRIWDISSGTCDHVLEAFWRGRWGRRTTGWSIVSYSGDYTLRIWDISSGTCDHLLEGHSEGVEGIVELRDGRIVSVLLMKRYESGTSPWNL